MRKKRGSGFLTKLLIVAFAVYSVTSIISQQIKINDQRTQNQNMKAEVEHQKLKNDELRTTIEAAGTDEFYEEIARDKLGYIKPGERIFVDISSI